MLWVDFDNMPRLYPLADIDALSDIRVSCVKATSTGVVSAIRKDFTGFGYSELWIGRSNRIIESK